MLLPDPETTPVPPAPPATPAQPAPPAATRDLKAWSQELADKGRALGEEGRKIGEEGRKLGEEARRRAEEQRTQAKGNTVAASPDVSDAKALAEQIRRSVAEAMNSKDAAKTITFTADDGSKHGRSSGSSHSEVPIVFIVFLFLFLIVKTIMGPINRRRGRETSVVSGPGLSADDSAILQKIHRTLGQMERRVEALETILADPRRTAAFTTVTRPSTAANPSTSYESKV